MRGEIGHQDDGRSRAARGHVGERAIDDARQRACAVVPKHAGAAREREIRDVVAVGRDEHPLQRARPQDVEHVLEQRAGEAGARVPVEDGAQPRLASRQGLRRHHGPRPAAHRTSRAASWSISRASSRRWSRERMTVDVPRTGIPSTVPSSPRSTTIAPTRPR